MKVNLFVQYYKDKNPARHEEIVKCLGMNIDNKLIDRIFLLTDIDFHVVDDKIRIIDHSGRATYNDFFNAISTYAMDEDINIISNSDIYFNHTLEEVLTMHPNMCYGLTRWDLDAQGNLAHYPHPDSQDCWIFKGHVRGVSGAFCLGKLGCDNRIAWEIKEAGYHILNLSKVIQACHMHLSGVRNWSRANKEDTIPPPYYVIPIT